MTDYIDYIPIKSILSAQIINILLHSLMEMSNCGVIFNKIALCVIANNLGTNWTITLSWFVCKLTNKRLTF